MTNEEAIRRMLLQEMLTYLPESLRSEILIDDDILEGVGMRADSHVVLEKGPEKVTCSRHRLFSSIRSALADRNVSVRLETIDGGMAEVSINEIEGIMYAVITCGEVRFELFYAFSLSEVVNERLDGMRILQRKLCLDPVSINGWRDKLSVAPLTDRECEEMYEALVQCPTVWEEKISRVFQYQDITTIAMVPDNQNYYGHLAGVWKRTSSAEEFIRNDLAARLDSYFEAKAGDALKRVFGLATHSLVSELVEERHLSQCDLEDSYSWILEFGDIISLIGAVEIGLRVLPEHRNLEPFIQKIVSSLIAQGGINDGWNRFANLFVVVDGQLSRRKTLAQLNPFMRRHAAIVQAGYLDRVLKGCGIRLEGFDKEFQTTHMLQFYAQSLVDLREEPYWRPEYARPEDWKAEIYGRLYIALHTYEANIKDPLLRAFCFDEDRGVPEYLNGLNLFRPGPLEGGGEAIRAMAVEEISELLSAIEVDPIPLDKLEELARFSDFYKFDVLHSERLARWFSRAGYRVGDEGNKEDYRGILWGLARMAAKTKCPALAESIAILSRIRRRSPVTDGRLDTEAGLAFVAAAAHESNQEWAKFVAGWLQELAVGNIKVREGELTIGLLKTIGAIEPILWRHCGHAYASLRAICSDNG